jgi:hypothetical protein
MRKGRPEVAEILPPGAPGVMIVDRGDLARQLRRLGQQAKARRGNPTDRELFDSNYSIRRIRCAD